MTQERAGSEYVAKGFLLLASQYGSMACSVLCTFWLARLLDPSDFGRLAVGVFSFDVFNALTDWGWEQGIFAAERDELEQAYATHFAVRCFLGSLPLLFGFGMICVDRTLASSSVHMIALVLAFAFWAEKIALTYKAILERSYALHHLAGYEILAVIGSYCCALASVYAGWGVFALVVQRLMERLLVLLGYVYASPWKTRLGFDVAVVKRWIRAFGYQTWLSGFVGLGLYDFMGAFVGVRSGVHEGGLYARSFKMATLPLMITVVFNRLTIPLYAASKGDFGVLKRIFLTAQFVKALLMIPIQLFFLATASWWIPVVLGAQWESAVTLYRVLGVYGLLRGFYDDVPSLFLYGVRSPWILLQQHIVQAVAMAAVGFVLSYWLSGAMLAAGVMCGAMAVAVLVIWTRIILLLQVTASDGIECVRRTVIAGMRVMRDCIAYYTSPKKDEDGEKKNSAYWGALF